MANRKLFDKWARWLEVIRRELVELVVQRQHFQELLAVTEPYRGRRTGAEAARWMAQGYYAYACLAVRRMTEAPKQNVPKKGDPRLTISLVVLLEDLAANASELTRDRQRRMYKHHMRAVSESVAIGAADCAFDQAARTKGASEMPVSRIRRDIAALKRTAKRIRRRVDKVYAHTERDKRRIGRHVRSAEIDMAIDLLIEVHRRYTLLVQGRDVRELVPEGGFDITSDLKKLWP
jgi:hypothetical protein